MKARHCDVAGRCEDSTAFGVRNGDNRTQTDTPSPVLFFECVFHTLVQPSVTVYAFLPYT